MRSLLLFIFTVLSGGLTGAPLSAAEHHEHNSDRHAPQAQQPGSSDLMVVTEPAPPPAGADVALKLMIHNPKGEVVRDFDVLHEKLVHLILVREGLDEFAHLHPTVDDRGNLRTTHTFSKAGKYLLFADYKPQGSEASVARAVLEVSGEAARPAPLVVSAPGQVTADGLQATIAIQTKTEHAGTQIRFQLANEAGQAITNLTPYLGARGHLVVLNAAGEEYVHAHPLEAAASANEVAFEAHFPASGLYKGWAQFQVDQRVRTVPFVVEIAD